MSKRYFLDGVSGDLEFAKNGPNVHANGTALENYTDDSNATLANVRGADPIIATDLTTKQWVELYVQSNGAIQVTGQIDGSIPTPPAAEGSVYIVTTAGGAFSLKELWRVESGAWVNLSIADGTVMVVTTDLSGGTDTYTGDHLYLWDELDTGTWVDVGPAATVTSVQKNIKDTLVFSDWAGSPKSLGSIPAGGTVTKVTIHVTTAFDHAATLDIGTVAGAIDELMSNAGIDLQNAGTYIISELFDYASGGSIVATLGDDGTNPTVGSAQVLIEYGID